MSPYSDEPREPKDTAQACPSEGMRTDREAENPMVRKRGAVTAMGTPKPPTPWRNEAKAHPRRRT
jgi:hypothetical protein